MTKTLLTACLTALVFAAGAPDLAVAAPAAATPPAAAAQSDPGARQIRAFYNTLLDSMKHAKELGVTGRYKKLAPAVDATFDFPAMTKMTVGPEWETMAEADRKTLIDAFRRMTIADYARNFDGYNGEAFSVDPNVQERADSKIVQTKMTAPGRAQIPFVYRMTKSRDGWKIADVYLNGFVSEVATRRADFSSTLKSGGAAALVQKLNAITDKMLTP